MGKKLAAKLEMIPTASGTRAFFARNHKKLLASFATFADKVKHTDLSLPQIEMVSVTTKETWYLKPAVIKAIIQEKDEDEAYKDKEGKPIKRFKGDIKHNFQKSIHHVAKYKEGTLDLHFKQTPLDPLRQKGVGSLTGRTGGYMTPTTELVSFKVEGRADPYPVLISETIDGVDLSETSDKQPEIDDDSWTWWILCSILTRPGDGLFPNFKVKDKNIFDVDNEISFIEPVTEEEMGRSKVKKIRFCSALFCISPQKFLSKKVLEKFADLNVDLILNAWIKELREEEKQHFSLFPPELEKKLFSVELGRKENQFSASMYLKKSYMITLHTQFWKLVNFCQANKGKDVPAISLLNELISITTEKDKESVVGGHIYQSYKKGIAAKTPGERLKIGAERPISESLTSLAARQASYGQSIPTYDQVKGSNKYSLEEAQKELYACISFRGNFRKKTRKGDEVFFEIDLIKFIDDIETCQLHFNAFQYQLNLEKDRITTLSFKNCASLTSKILEPFLQSSIKDLEFHHCNKMDNSFLSHIQQKCPRLKTLKLENCSLITLLENPRTFASLELLEIYRCPMTSIKLEVPLLKTLRTDQLNLTTVELRAQSSVLLDIPDNVNPVMKGLRDTDLPFFRVAKETTLDLSGSEVTLGGFTTLKDLPLTKLDLSKSQLGLEALVHVKAITTLKELDLTSWYLLRDESLSFLEPLTNLTSLNLSRCKLLTNESLETLSKLSFLKSLELSECNQIDEDAKSTLKASLKDLNIIDI